MNTHFTQEDIAKLAQLAHLEVNPAEIAALTHDLEQILTYVDRLEAVDVSGLEPMQNCFDASDVWREDVVHPSLPVEVVLQNAPRKAETFFSFPRIVPGKRGETKLSASTEESE